MTLEDTIRSNAHIEIIAHPEDTHPRDAYHECPDLDEVVQDIIERSEHNVWAWCVVEVNVSFNGVEASQYLGQCSYESGEDFKRSGDGYYQDFVNECVAEIASTLRSHARLVNDHQ